MLEKLSHWIQILSGMVLIVGVFLVVAQMQQTERLTRAQMTGEWFNNRASQAGTAAGENPMHSLAKLCDPNADVQLEDALVIHALFLQRLYMGQNGLATAAVMESAADQEAALGIFQTQMALVVAFRQGREWMKAFPLSEELRKVVESSPYYNIECSFDRDPVGSILRADREVKAAMRGS